MGLCVLLRQLLACGNRCRVLKSGPELCSELLYIRHCQYGCEEVLIKRKCLIKHLEEKETKHLGLKLTAMELKLTEMETVIEGQRQSIVRQNTEMLQQRTEMLNNFYDIITTKIQWSVSNIPVVQLEIRRARRATSNCNSTSGFTRQ